MCDVSVAWYEGQGVITEVTSFVGNVRACWGFSRTLDGNLPRPALAVDEDLITNSDSINSLATGCSGFPNITPRRPASVSESAGTHITGLPREVAALSIWMRATRITPGWSANRKLRTPDARILRRVQPTSKTRCLAGRYLADSRWA